LVDKEGEEYGLQGNFKLPEIYDFTNWSSIVITLSNSDKNKEAAGSVSE
jgi:hypothetical protein